METVMQQLKLRFNHQIEAITTVGKAEMTIELKPEVELALFSQQLQDHLVDLIDGLTLLRINIVDHTGKLCDSFASNQ